MSAEMGTREPFTRTVHVAELDPALARPGYPRRVVVTVEWDGETLRLQGVEGPGRNGDCAGSCGQITMRGGNHVDRAPSYDRLADVWDRWHLNSMRAGSPRQEAFLRGRFAPFPGHPTGTFERAREALAAAGLHPDADHPLNGEPYAYGSAWLPEEVPDDVLSFLRELPNNGDLPPLWAR